MNAHFVYWVWIGSLPRGRMTIEWFGGLVRKDVTAAYGVRIGRWFIGALQTEELIERDQLPHAIPGAREALIRAEEHDEREIDEQRLDPTREVDDH